MTKLKEQHALDAIADTVLAYRPKARSNTMTGIVAMAMNTDEYGLNVDMLDVDRLRDWARLIDVHGDHISDWGDPKFVSGKLRDIADRLADEVRDVGTLRALVREASEIMQITYAGNFPAGIESFLVRAQQAGTGNQDAPRRAIEDRAQFMQLDKFEGEMKPEKQKIVVEIDNVTEAQAIAIEDMLATWMQLGGLGASRWTAFYADGDGNFHPRITIDGRKAEHTKLLTREEKWKHAENSDWGGSEYRIDFDRIAWKLRA